MDSPSARPPTRPTEVPLVERAHAKINLDLLVLGRRPDGYHELDSLVVFADIGDELTFEPADGLRLDVAGPFGGRLDDPDNLALRAARLLAAEAGMASDARILLDKRLPVAAGLGGGSADAAAALRGLSRLWRLGLALEDLERLALRLGADVPACVRSRPVRVQGIGERLEPLPLPELALLLVHGGEPLATAAVFAALGPIEAAPRPFAATAMRDSGRLAVALRESRNDLEAPAYCLLPGLAAQIAELAGLSGCLLARMSGSGAALFALFEDESARDAAARTLAARHPGWWVRPTRLARPSP